MRSAEDGVPMETETGSAASSTTRRPKAKARPRQPTVMANVIIIRYDNPRNLGTDAANRRGKYLVCRVDSEEIGLESQDAVGKLIENVVGHSRQTVTTTRRPNPDSRWMWTLACMSTRGTRVHLTASEEESWS